MIERKGNMNNIRDGNVWCNIRNRRDIDISDTLHVELEIAKNIPQNDTHSERVKKLINQMFNQ